ncbi:MAG: ribonuclease P protein subunit [Methanomassiliicoccaceae archaeon]|nr:ribonuclease P protein subunit [Methanomassiliicoccaceae archaeon]MCL2145682.1 ribonuclease P protein subunit [Methanomassiliicoccaceae archaeon]
MKRSDFMRSEFIGLDVAVLSAPYSGISGKVVDETKNTITVSSAGTEKMVPKQGNEFRFTYESEHMDIKGIDIQHRPEDRIKKVR